MGPCGNALWSDMVIQESFVFLGGVSYSLLLAEWTPTLMKSMIWICSILAALKNATGFNLDEVEKSFSWKFRTGCSSGLFIIPLLPTAFIVSIPLSDQGNPVDFGTTVATFSCSLLICSTVYILMLTLSPEGSTVAAGLTGFLMGCFHIAWLVCPLRCLPLLVTALGVYLYLQQSLPRWFPGSFSLGESVLLSQGAAMFTFIITDKWWTMVLKSHRHLPQEFDNELVTFTETAVVCAVLVIIILASIRRLQNSAGLYLVNLTVAVTVAYPYLSAFFQQHPVTWLYHYITKNKPSIYLFFYWAFGCATAVYIVVTNTPSNLEKDTPRAVSTVTRKNFHFLAVAMFIPGIIVDSQMMFCSATCAVVIFVMLECVRLLQAWPLGSLVHTYLQVFVDEKDGGPLILTHLYLLLGMTGPLWCYYGSYIKGPPAILLSGVLSIGVGDTAASIIGSSYGHARWPGSQKTIEGTVASVLAQLLFAKLCQVTGLFPSLYYSSLFIPVLLVSLLEAFTSQIDNIVLPVFMYIMLVGK